MVERKVVGLGPPLTVLIGEYYLIYYHSVFAYRCRLVGLLLGIVLEVDAIEQNTRAWI